LPLGDVPPAGAVPPLGRGAPLPAPALGGVPVPALLAGWFGDPEAPPRALVDGTAVATNAGAAGDAFE
jgi:hypothetical protein